MPVGTDCFLLNPLYRGPQLNQAGRGSYTKPCCHPAAYPLLHFLNEENEIISSISSCSWEKWELSHKSLLLMSRKSHTKPRQTIRENSMDTEPTITFHQAQCLVHIKVPFWCQPQVPADCNLVPACHLASNSALRIYWSQSVVHQIILPFYEDSTPEPRVHFSRTQSIVLLWDPCTHI